MGKIAELYGLDCGNTYNDYTTAVNLSECPYTGKLCAKCRKSDSGTRIGVCTVEHKKDNVIICPNRLLERNQVFFDCLHLLTQHEPGNELHLIPEVSMACGNIDYVLVSSRKKKVVDFVGIELQSMDTIGSVWAEREQFLKTVAAVEAAGEGERIKGFGINWKMTAKTILVQIHHKAGAFERFNKHLVLVIQNPLLKYMQGNFNFSNITDNHRSDTIHLHSYDLNDEDEKLKLLLNKRLSTDCAGIEAALGLNKKRQDDILTLYAELEAKLSEDNCLKFSA